MDGPGALMSGLTQQGSLHARRLGSTRRPGGSQVKKKGGRGDAFPPFLAAVARSLATGGRAADGLTHGERGAAVRRSASLPGCTARPHHRWRCDEERTLPFSRRGGGSGEEVSLARCHLSQKGDAGTPGRTGRSLQWCIPPAAANSSHAPRLDSR
ncbi:hypothetical protein NDU88_011139 [Pleurodeles waltl]|uniref:Uncharacterized protein n=1 Tax=Pleurodeles waltl TaxID=8319 RepID=A0AAV7S091_PLEWA|nr:hypothetical protein NDU88_011139 [Pleurodeles waltl]